MTKSFYEADGYQELISDVKKIEEMAGRLYSSATRATIQNTWMAYDKDGLVAQFQQDCVTLRGRFTELVRTLKKYGAELDEAIRRRQQSVEGMETVDYPFPSFSNIELPPITEIYSGYTCYAFMQAGLSFSKDFNDIQAFMQSDLYKTKDSFETGLSDLSNWLSLLGQYATGNLDEYTNDRLKSALKMVLDGLPGAGSTDLSFTDPFKEEMKNATGIEHFDGWMDELCMLLKKAAAAGEGPKFFESEEYLEWLWRCDEKQAIVHELLTAYITEDMWKEIGNSLSTLDDLSDAAEWMDTMFGLFEHCMTDYSTQIGYLDSMQDMMLSAGYPYGPVHQIINELREEYNDDVLYAVRTVGQKISREVVKSGTKALISHSALISNVDLGLKAVGTTAKLMFADDISADKTLMGLVQYDQVLTKSYEKYLQMAQEGIANEDDMKKLDQVFNILVSTKKQEYESMMTLSKGTAWYDIYGTKLDELEKWLNPER